MVSNYQNHWLTTTLYPITAKVPYAAQAAMRPAFSQRFSFRSGSYACVRGFQSSGISVRRAFHDWYSNMSARAPANPAVAAMICQSIMARHNRRRGPQLSGRERCNIVAALFAVSRLVIAKFLVSVDCLRILLRSLSRLGNALTSQSQPTGRFHYSAPVGKPIGEYSYQQLPPALPAWLRMWMATVVELSKYGHFAPLALVWHHIRTRRLLPRPQVLLRRFASQCPCALIIAEHERNSKMPDVLQPWPEGLDLPPGTYAMPPRTLTLPEARAHLIECATRAAQEDLVGATSGDDAVQTKG